MEDGEGLTQEHLHATQGHGKQCEDCLGLGTVWGWVKVGKGREVGTMGTA